MYGARRFPRVQQLIRRRVQRKVTLVEYIYVLALAHLCDSACVAGLKICGHNARCSRPDFRFAAPFQPAELVDLTKGITHETAANDDRDSADRRKRMGAPLPSAESGGKYAGGGKKGTVQHVEHESNQRDRGENSTAPSR